ncbi:MAG: hypothetical protein LBG81_05235 [Coriobacteriaceae bacterium]|nr:hypothetical protein [Coriobacteriaceae bacterium]
MQTNDAASPEKAMLTPASLTFMEPNWRPHAKNMPAKPMPETSCPSREKPMKAREEDPAVRRSAENTTLQHRKRKEGIRPESKRMATKATMLPTRIQE